MSDALTKAFARFVKESYLPAYSAGKIAEWAQQNAGQTFATADKRSESLAGHMRAYRVPSNQIDAAVAWVRDVESRGVHGDGSLGAERPPAAASTRDMTPPPPPPRTEHQRWAADQTAALRQGGPAADAYWNSARDPALDSELRGAWQQAANDTAAQAPAPASGGGSDGAQ